jgi:hypothetical protein
MAQLEEVAFAKLTAAETALVERVPTWMPGIRSAEKWH